MTMQSDAVTWASLSPTSTASTLYYLFPPPLLPSSRFCLSPSTLQEAEAKIAARQDVVAGPLKDKFGKLVGRLTTAGMNPYMTHIFYAVPRHSLKGQSAH